MLFVVTLVANLVSQKVFDPTVIQEFFTNQELLELMDIKSLDIKTEAASTID